MKHEILCGDVLDRLRSLSDGSVQCGLEPSPEEYVATMVAVFREIRRVLRDDGVVMRKRLRIGEPLDTGVCEYVVREVQA